MAKFGVYEVNLKNFSGKEQVYKYLLENAYFANIDNDEMRKGKVQVDLTVCRKGTIFELNFCLQGSVKVPCDRCLDEVELPVESRNKLMVKFGKEFSEENDEVIVVPEEEGAINVAWFLYEFIVLSLPMKHVHAPGKCNREMSAHLHQHTVPVDDEGVSIDNFDIEATEEEL
ncbi:MAG: DUF177 domain-containing protein [Tannerellaceae bacterium]|jgi:uncharacterized metal-binding protein YceD (DUF177 family)|nr:DUF177 domain-containing protein [Tannerellaceae bacterium]